MKTISLRTFILGEVRIFEREFSPRFLVEFRPNSWAESCKVQKETNQYYELNDAQTSVDCIVKQAKQTFNANK